MKVVIDTNIWISDLALRSEIGSAVRFYLQNTGAEVCVPEVVRLETEENLREILSNHVNNANRSFRQLLAIFGELKELVLPSADEIEGIVSGVFSELDVTVRDIPFTESTARDSFLRTVRKIPPSDKNQQFKDGVIWADCLDLLAEDHVCLVTKDKAFYENREYANGLASELQREIADKSNNFRLFANLAELLKNVKSDYEIDEEKLVEAYLNENLDVIDQMSASSGFSLTGNRSCTTKLYATEEATRLFVEFEIRFDCRDDETEAASGEILAKGIATLHTVDNEFENVSRRGEQLLIYAGEDLESIVQNTVVAVGGAVLGHRTVRHAIRHEL